MNIAFLFNSDDPKYNGSYGDPIRDVVFGPGIVQASGRHMKVRLGDVLLHFHARNQDAYLNLAEKVYDAHTWSSLIVDRLVATFGQAVPFAIIFENMPQKLAENLHSALAVDGAYLGALEVDYDYGPHLALFRNSMICRYRVEGATCRIFYSMGEDDDKDIYEAQAMGSLGYTDVDWEDRGAHGTIFDDYDTPAHFQLVKAFCQAVAPYLPEGHDDASELAMVLEDLNPRLFNALGSAVVALGRARNEEDVAQAAISGRRFLEQLADVLFPPQTQLHNNRAVNKQQYKNRLWAFIADNIQDAARIKLIGAELDRLIEEFNAGLHGDMTKERMLKALSDTALLTSTLLALNPQDVRKPYYAHRQKMLDVFREAFGGRESSSSDTT
ncbi:hypothetical protein [Ensifer sp. 4252]|uniref:hypothetical protein n=1 Tax=Ensifer sp. 4252 TaxID=3373915 RepID=UPI003D1B3333